MWTSWTSRPAVHPVHAAAGQLAEANVGLGISPAPAFSARVYSLAFSNGCRLGSRLRCTCEASNGRLSSESSACCGQRGAGCCLSCGAPAAGQQLRFRPAQQPVKAALPLISGHHRVGPFWIMNVCGHCSAPGCSCHNLPAATCSEIRRPTSAGSGSAPPHLLHILRPLPGIRLF